MLLATTRDLQTTWPVLPFAFRSLAACFFVLGLIALGYSTRISLAGKKFSEVYGDGTTMMTYRYAFQSSEPIDMTRVNERAVSLLSVFDSMAKRSRTQGQSQ
jgi:hypothetical protein